MPISTTAVQDVILWLSYQLLKKFAFLSFSADPIGIEEY